MAGAGRDLERAGAIEEAVRCYDAAIDAAERAGDGAVLAEALRRRGVVHHLRHEPAPPASCASGAAPSRWRTGCRCSAAEAINALAGFDFESGAIEAAREGFYEAVSLGGESAALRARIEQNLGIIANMQGAVAEALAHYRQSLHAYRARRRRPGPRDRLPQPRHGQRRP